MVVVASQNRAGSLSTKPGKGKFCRTGKRNDLAVKRALPSTYMGGSQSRGFPVQGIQSHLLPRTSTHVYNAFTHKSVFRRSKPWSQQMAFYMEINFLLAIGKWKPLNKEHFAVGEFGDSLFSIALFLTYNIGWAHMKGKEKPYVNT